MANGDLVAVSKKEKELVSWMTYLLSYQLILAKSVVTFLRKYRP